MNSRTHILNELAELQSSLPLETPSGPYTVPSGYFEGLADAVLAKIKGNDVAAEIAELSPLLAGLSRKMPYDVPAGFFQQTSLEAIMSDEELPQILAGISRDMPYKVPQGYFENLPQTILGRVERPQAKVVSMGKKWMRMAAAAVIAGAVAVSAYVYFAKSNTTDITVDNPQWVAKNLKDVNTKDLEAFIKESDVTIAQVSKPKTTKTVVKEAKVKTLLTDVSNEELEAFLDQVPVEEDDLTLLN